MRCKLALGGVLFLLISCNSNQLNEKNKSIPTTDFSKIIKMEWVLGTWENTNSEGVLYEIWTKSNDSVYAGKSFMIANKDTVFSESISLELKQNELYYIPTVSNQNNAQPVEFKFISSDNSTVIFENKKHDFPQRIIYKNPTLDSLYARVEGEENGKFRKEEFFMKRHRQ
jgi:hypothetical protein